MSSYIEPEEEDDNLGVPAGALRIILGLFAMVSGMFIAAFSSNAFGDGFGLLLFLISPFIMITSKKKEKSVL